MYTKTITHRIAQTELAKFDWPERMIPEGVRSPDDRLVRARP